MILNNILIWKNIIKYVKGNIKIVFWNFIRFISFFIIDLSKKGGDSNKK